MLNIYRNESLFDLIFTISIGVFHSMLNRYAFYNFIHVKLLCSGAKWMCARIIAFTNLLYILIASFVASAVKCALRTDETVEPIL